MTTKIKTNRILSKERLWKELEQVSHQRGLYFHQTYIIQVNKQFLFSASSPGTYGDDTDARQGLALGHAYSIIKVVEKEDEHDKSKLHRLVLIR